VQNRSSKVPGMREAGFLRQFMQEQGIIVGVSGQAANVFKISPPLIIDGGHVDRFLTTFSAALRAVTKERVSIRI